MGQSTRGHEADVSKPQQQEARRLSGQRTWARTGISVQGSCRYTRGRQQKQEYWCEYRARVKHQADRRHVSAQRDPSSCVNARVHIDVQWMCNVGAVVVLVLYGSAT